MPLPAAIAGSIIGSVIAGLLFRLLSALFVNAAKFASVVAIPLLWNMQVDWAKYGFQKLSEFVGGAGFQLPAIEYMGLGGWLADCLRIPDCLGLFIAAVQVVAISRVLFR